MGGQACGHGEDSRRYWDTGQEDDITWKGLSPSLSSLKGEGETEKEKVPAGWLGGSLLWESITLPEELALAWHSSAESLVTQLCKASCGPPLKWFCRPTGLVLSLILAVRWGWRGRWEPRALSQKFTS